MIYAANTSIVLGIEDGISRFRPGRFGSPLSNVSEPPRLFNLAQASAQPMAAKLLRRRTVRAAAVMVAGATVLAALPVSAAPESSSGRVFGDARGVHEGLSASDWSSIRAAYEAKRHTAFAVEGGYEVRNPGQEWRTRFDGRGFLTTPDTGEWSWGLDLMSYGRGEDQRTVAAPSRVSAKGPRIEYVWDDALSEWYVNDARGLEHGFTVHRPPPSQRFDLGATRDEPLRFMLTMRGNLRPRISGSGRDATFVSGDGAAIIHYHGLKVFDSTGVELSAWFDTVGDGLRLNLDDRSARYPLTIDPVAQQAYLKPSNTNAGDSFGFSVAVSGDTVVVGAPNEDSSATGVNGNQADNSAVGAGAAYVFVRSGGVWIQQAYLKASNTNASDQFGYSVAVSGDTVVVGAWREASSATGVNGNQADNSAVTAGAAYVFIRSGGVWIQQAYLKASNTEADDEFSRSVAVSGDTVVVGAIGEDSSATGVNGNVADNSAVNAGAAYVFVRSGGVWTQQAYLKASNTEADDRFSGSVAVSGDTVVVGATGEDSSATGVNGNAADNSAVNAGAAYVFVRNGGVWTQQAYLKASNTGAADVFGVSVAVSGDTVVVGALYEDSSATGVNGNQADNSATDSGAAYVFVRSGGTWGQQAYLKPSNTGGGSGAIPYGDIFGASVAVSGNTAVVGAYLEDSSATGVNGNEADNSTDGSGAATAVNMLILLQVFVAGWG